jgi:hypothetical protein
MALIPNIQRIIKFTSYSHGHHQEYFPTGSSQFENLLTNFKPIKTDFTDCPGVSKIEKYIFLKIPLILGINMLYIS